MNSVSAISGGPEAQPADPEERSSHIPDVGPDVSSSLLSSTKVILDGTPLGSPAGQADPSSAQPTLVGQPDVVGQPDAERQPDAGGQRRPGDDSGSDDGPTGAMHDAAGTLAGHPDLQNAASGSDGEPTEATALALGQN